MSEYKCLVFSAEITADANEQIIWINTVTKVANLELPLLRLDGQPIPTLEAFNALSAAEKAACVIIAKIQGMIIEDGMTVSYAEVRKIYQLENWWIAKPDDPALMAGVTDYVEDDYDPSWNPPVE